MHIPSRLEVRKVDRILVVQSEVGGGDIQVPVLAPDGVSRVHRHVHENLFHLPLVGHDPIEAGLKRLPDLDRLADQTPQHSEQTVHDFVEIERFGLDHRTPAEGQELLGEAGRAFAGVEDGREGIPLRVGGGLPGEQHVGVAVDHRQEVVEVVGDAPGKPADRLHFR